MKKGCEKVTARELRNLSRGLLNYGYPQRALKNTLMSKPTMRVLVLMLALTPAAAIHGSSSAQNQQPPQEQQGDSVVDDVVVVTASRR